MALLLQRVEPAPPQERSPAGRHAASVERPATARIPCVVPFCRRTKADDSDGVLVDGGWLPFDEWICGAHWRLIAPRLRKRHAAAKRRLRAQRDARTARLMQWLWRRCRRQAIERAGGL